MMTTSLVNLPDWVAWLAQDADGACWGYEVEPNQQHNGWYENEVGRIVRLGQTEPPDSWETTLTKRKDSSICPDLFVVIAVSAR